MVSEIDYHTWKLLRILVRAAGPVTGKALRHSPNRYTKDGTFLDRLCDAGLIRVHEVPPADAPPRPDGTPDRRPAQFRALYALTDLGAVAAEYGECELSDTARRALRRSAGRL